MSWSYSLPCRSHIRFEKVWSLCVSVRYYSFTLSLRHPPIVFILLAWKVEPRNYLLFACHITNATAQVTQGYRFVDYWHRGGREKKSIQAASPPDAAKGKVTEAVKAAQAASQSTK
jgi:hypothetical protein